MTAAAPISTIHVDPWPPMPVSAIGVVRDRYVFELPSGAKHALTFRELCDPERLVALCGGDLMWLGQNFPGTCHFYDVRGGEGRWVSTGISSSAAAHHLATECIRAQTVAIQTALRATPRRRWWQRLRDWLDGLFVPSGLLP